MRGLAPYRILPADFPKTKRSVRKASSGCSAGGEFRYSAIHDPLQSLAARSSNVRTTGAVNHKLLNFGARLRRQMPDMADILQLRRSIIVMRKRS